MEIRPDGMAPLHNYDLCIIEPLGDDSRAGVTEMELGVDVADVGINGIAGWER